MKVFALELWIVLGIGWVLSSFTDTPNPEDVKIVRSRHPDASLEMLGGEYYLKSGDTPLTSACKSVSHAWASAADYIVRTSPDYFKIN